LPTHHYARIGILHTDPAFSGIAEALRTLMPVLEADYTGCQVIQHEIRISKDKALDDIVDQVTAEAYLHGLVECIRHYRQQHIPVHLLVSGGRKAMSIYATIAATYTFGDNDVVWTVLTEPHVMAPGKFHAEPEERQCVEAVQLNILRVNMPPGAMTDVEAILKRRDHRAKFLASLTKQEEALADIYRQMHPTISNRELGDVMSKSHRTIENQFASMYGKLELAFNIDLSDNDKKRHVLHEILTGRL